MYHILTTFQDLYVLSGRIDTKDASCSVEHCGVIQKVGSSVQNFQVGDTVVAMAPGKFGTYETVPEWACCKLKPSESLQVSLNSFINEVQDSSSKY